MSTNGSLPDDDASAIALTVAINEQVERILTSQEFAESDQLQNLLRYLVDKRLAGDTQLSPVVRVQAGQLRRRLQYYYLTKGRNDPIHIDLPKEKPVPVFKDVRNRRPAPQAPAPAPKETVAPQVPMTPVPEMVEAEAPVSAPSLESSEQPVPLDDPRHTPTILVVDDEPDLENLVRRRFRHRIRDGELAFLFSHDGEEALEVLNDSSEVDLVLTDINMPRMDGLTLLGRMNAINPLLRAVVISAYGDMANIRRAMNNGAFDFITKPIEFDDLTTTIDRTLEHIAMLKRAASEHHHLVSLRRELAVARRVQKSILPSYFPDDDDLSVYAETRPAREVSGDFYDVFPIDQRRWGVVIADVAGTGVPAALFMGVAQTLIRSIAVSGLSVAHCLAKTNELLCQRIGSGMSLSVCFAILDRATGQVKCANAGHSIPYVLRSDGRVEAFPGESDVVLGAKQDAHFPEASITLAPGESLFFYTDGITEAFDGRRRQFSGLRLEETLTNSRELEPRALTEKVFYKVVEFIDNAEPHDDMTCLALKFTRPMDEETPITLDMEPPGIG